MKVLRKYSASSSSFSSSNDVNDDQRHREREKRERETRETRTRFNCYCDVVIDDADTNIIHSAKENNDGGKFRAQNARKRRRERRTQNDVLFVF